MFFWLFLEELHTAAKKKNMERVKELIDSGFDVNTRDYFGWTPLHESINDDPSSFAILKV
jgi:ankyrin repeat protein